MIQQDKSATSADAVASAYPLHAFVGCVLGAQVLAHHVQQLVPAQARLTFVVGHLPEASAH